jgi:hypothetical protein
MFVFEGDFQTVLAVVTRLELVVFIVLTSLLPKFAHEFHRDIRHEVEVGLHTSVELGKNVADDRVKKLRVGG